MVALFVAIDSLSPSYDGIPTKEHDDPNKHYIFTGWSNGSTTLTTLPKVTGNATYTAVFGNEVDRYVGGDLTSTITWKIDRTTGTLIISGTGAMPNWVATEGAENHFNNRPWMPYMSEIQNVVVESGITTVGSFSFCHLDNLTTVTIAEGVTRLNQDAFSYNAALTTLYLPASITAIGQGCTYQSNNLKTVYGGWETVQGLIKAIGSTAYNDALKAAEYISTFVAPEPEPNPDAGITPAEDEITLQEGQSGKIEATVIPAFPEDSTDLVFRTDSDCITLNADGSFTAIKAGTATVTITTADGLIATVTITVTAAPVIDPDTPVVPPAESGDNAVYATIVAGMATIALAVLVLKKRSNV